MTDPALITEQLRHTLDLLKAENARLIESSKHAQQLANHRLQALETQAKDFEERIRSLQDSSTQFKVLAGLATGGGLLSLINIIRSFSGG